MYENRSSTHINSMNLEDRNLAYVHLSHLFKLCWKVNRFFQSEVMNQHRFESVSWWKTGFCNSGIKSLNFVLESCTYDQAYKNRACGHIEVYLAAFQMIHNFQCHHTV